MAMIRVRAVEGHDVPLTDESGRTVLGAAHVGKTKDNKIMPEGILVPDTAYYLRRVERGALELVTESAKKKSGSDSDRRA